MTERMRDPVAPYRFAYLVGPLQFRGVGSFW
jgi:hypothetical protein